MKTLHFLFCYFTVLLFGCTLKPDARTDKVPGSEKPNVVLIMADDLGYNDLGCYGNTEIKTPHLDRLAADGVRFTDYHSNGAVCSPTRAALLTGRYQQRAGIGGVVTAKNHRHTGLGPEQYTMADFFSGQGYETAIIGKWHLGYDTAFSPLNNGFKYFKGYVSGNIDYHSHIDQVGHYDWWQGKATITEEGYSTDLISQTAINFVEENKGNPFFLYIAHEAPHYPFQGRDDPADRTVGGTFDTHGSREDKKGAYKEMIEAMDEGVGALMKKLDDLKLLENTLVIFCSDNGAMSVGSNSPLNGSKGSLWEGGHRVPAMAFWKDKIMPGTTDETVLSMDIFPTLVQLLEQPLQQEKEFDGQGFLPLLLKEKEGAWQDRPVFWMYKNKRAVRSGPWKYMVDGNEAYLFNLTEDLSEQNNLIEEQKEIRDQMEAELTKWTINMEGHEKRTE